MTTEAKPLNKKAQKAAEQQEAIARLRQYLKPGDTVYTLLRHVSSSGMSRHISLFIIHDNQPFDISHWASKALDYRRNDKSRGLVVGGFGMDMGFHVVYSLSCRLFPDGFGIMPNNGKDMPKTGIYERPKTKEQAAEMVSRHGFKFRGRNGDTSGWDNDGGYALNHKWM